MKLQFSGHESFICKHFWLKKGYDFIQSKGNFNDESAVIALGVGKNMVISINYWLKAFGIVDTSNRITDIGHFIFHDRKGADPYMESLNTVWLLHYLLIRTNKASIYNLFFNEFRKARTEFTKDQFLNFIERKMKDEDQKNFNANTAGADISVLIRNYLNPSYKETKVDVEEDFASLMIDLDLLKSYQSENMHGKLVDWYQVENKVQIDLVPELVLFSILDNETYGKSIAFKELLTGYNSPGAIFALNEDGLYNKIEAIVSEHKGITYTETAGVRELQFKSKPNKEEILHECYKD